jgi:hypothetical protein
MAGLGPSEAHRAAHKDLGVAEADSLPKAAPSYRLAQEEDLVEAVSDGAQVQSLTTEDLGARWPLVAGMPGDGHQSALEPHRHRWFGRCGGAANEP